MIPRLTIGELRALPPHRWELREHRATNDGLVSARFQCARCRRYAVTITKTGDDGLEGGQCGVPELNEHWRVDGKDGLVWLIDYGDMVFKLRHEDGSESTHPLGTPDETPPSP